MHAILHTVRSRTWLTLLVLWAALTLMSAAWALATPLGGSPDEPAHIIKAASVVRGQFIGEHTGQAAVTRVEVPQSLAGANNWTCFAFHPDVQASCAAPIPHSGQLESATTTAGLYDPVYYLMVGWPSLMTDSASVAVFSMRIVSAVISSFFLAVAMCALLMFRKPVVAGLGLLAVATPMVFFLNGAVNPNSLEFTAGAALISVLLLLVRGPTLQQMWPALAAVALSGALLANARGISPLWMALIGLIVVVAAPWPRLKALLARPGVWLTLAILIAAVAFAGWWLLLTNTLSSMGDFPGAGQTSPQSAFVTMITNYSFDPGLVGVFGWLDTMAPAVAYVIWSALAVAVLVLAVAVARGRSLWGVAVAGAVFLFVPPIVQALSVEKSGFIWQGRYTLVAYVMLLVASAVAAAEWLPRLAAAWAAPVRRAVWAVLVMFALGQVWTLMTVIKRYAVGVAATWGEFFRHPLWAPPGGLMLWPVVALVGTAVFAFVWFAWMPGRRERPARSLVGSTSV